MAPKLYLTENDPLLSIFERFVKLMVVKSTVVINLTHVIMDNFSTSIDAVMEHLTVPMALMNFSFGFLILSILVFIEATIFRN